MRRSAGAIPVVSGRVFSGRRCLTGRRGAACPTQRPAVAPAEGYRDHRDSYRATATSLGFEGHMSWAEAMP
jgi:hypothetical protein